MNIGKFNWFWAIILPLVGVVVLGTLFATLPLETVDWMKSEAGPVENLSALVFLAIGVVGLWLVWRSRGVAGWWARAFYLMMALGGFFMAGEETSYGQHIVGWSSPAYFEENSKQQETNLHNLYNDRPSKLMRRVAEIGLPITVIIVPIIFMLTRSYVPNDWPYWVLPKAELMLWVFLAAMARPLTDMRDHGWSERFSREVSEVAELYWAMAIFVWVLVLLRRVNTQAATQAAEAAPPDSPTPTEPPAFADTKPPVE